MESDEIRLQGELPAAELDFGVKDEMIRAEKPLRYDLSVELLHDALLVTGSLSLPLACECARCLKKFKTELKLTNVARASLEELMLDYEDFLRKRELHQWEKDNSEALAVREKWRKEESDKSDWSG